MGSVWIWIGFFWLGIVEWSCMNVIKCRYPVPCKWRAIHLIHPDNCCRRHTTNPI